MNTNKGLSRRTNNSEISRVYSGIETPEKVLRREHMTTLRKLGLPIAGHDLDLGEHPLLDHTPSTVPGKSVRKAALRKYPVCAQGDCTSPSEEIAWIIPRQRGGSNRADNIIGSCRKCKRLRGRMLPEEVGWSIKAPVKKPHAREE